MMRRFTNLWFIAAVVGFGCGADGDPSGDDGPTACIGGEFCVGNLVCVDGFCVEPGDSTNSSMDETTMGSSTDDPTTETTDDPTGDGDGDTGDGDGDTGDGDGDTGDGDGDTGDGDGDSGDGDGDGDGDPGMMCTTYDPTMCDAPGVVVMPDSFQGEFCTCECDVVEPNCPSGPVGTVGECVIYVDFKWYCGLVCEVDNDACPGASSCEWAGDFQEPNLGICTYP